MSAVSSTTCPFAIVEELQVPQVPFAGEILTIELAAPREATGVVLLARGNGNIVRNRSVAAELRENGFATATCQLLTTSERNDLTAIKRVAADIPLLAARLGLMIAAVREQSGVSRGPLGIVASGSVAPAALSVARRHPRDVGAIVSREGRVDLARHLDAVRCPTLLIVAGTDRELIRINEAAFQRLQCTKSLDVLAGASHRLDDPDAFETASRLTCNWFVTHLGVR
jgi:hypothetical protein